MLSRGDGIFDIIHSAFRPDPENGSHYRWIARESSLALDTFQFIYSDVERTG